MHRGAVEAERVTQRRVGRGAEAEMPWMSTALGITVIALAAMPRAAMSAAGLRRSW